MGSETLRVPSKLTVVFAQANSDTWLLSWYHHVRFHSFTLFSFLISLNAPFTACDATIGHVTLQHINPLALELDIYSLAHHLCKMCIFYEPRRVALGNTRHFVEE